RRRTFSPWPSFSSICASARQMSYCSLLSGCIDTILKQNGSLPQLAHSFMRTSMLSGSAGVVPMPALAYRHAVINSRPDSISRRAYVGFSKRKLCPLKRTYLSALAWLCEALLGVVCHQYPGVHGLRFQSARYGLDAEVFCGRAE